MRWMMEGVRARAPRVRVAPPQLEWWCPCPWCCNSGRTIWTAQSTLWQAQGPCCSGRIFFFSGDMGSAPPPLGGAAAAQHGGGAGWGGEQPPQTTAARGQPPTGPTGAAQSTLPPPLDTKAQARRLEAVLLGAAQPYGTPFEYALAQRMGLPRRPSRDTPGAVVRVAWPSGGVSSCWYMSATRALIDPAAKVAAAQAASCGTFALWLVGCGGRPDQFYLAMEHATGALPPPSLPALALPDAMAQAWGRPRAARALGWATAEPAPLLPVTLTELQRIRGVVDKRAREEDVERSERSLELRAAAVLMARHMQRDIVAGARARGPKGLERRAAAKAITAMLSASEDAKAPKPFFWDVEGIVKNAQWPRVDRGESGFDSWGYLPPPPPGHLQQVDAKKLGEAYLATVGEGNVPDDHCIWTALKEIRGHTQALAPHLREALDKAHAEGGPLLLFDKDKLEPLPEGAGLGLFLEQIDRLEGQGTLLELSEQQQRDPSMCAAVAYLGVVYKSTLARSPQEEAAVQADDMPTIARLAKERAEATLKALKAELATAAGEGGSSASLHPAVRLEHLVAGAAGSVSKTRPVARFQAFSRGDKRLGLEPNGVIPRGCTTPQLLSILAGATRKHKVGRLDAVDFFYTIGLSPEGKALSCLAVWDPRIGRLRIFQLQGLCMGQSSAPAVAELTSTLVALIANARGAAQGTCSGWQAQCDDLITLAVHDDLKRATDILVALMDEVGMVEAKKKRVWGARGQCLGKDFDMEQAKVSIPADRMHRYLFNLHLALEALRSPDPDIRASVTTDNLSKIAGALSWISEVTISGPLHLNALYAVTSRGKSLALCRERVIAELQWWAEQAASDRLSTTLSLDGGEVHTAAMDASDFAMGAVADGRALWRLLLPAEATMSSTRREMRAVEMTLRELGPSIRNSTLVLSTDSMPAALALNKGRLRGKGGMGDLERVFELMERYNIHVVALWIPREFNQLPDAISKCASHGALEEWARANGMTPTVCPPPPQC